MAHISTSVILGEVSTLDQPLFPMMLCKARETQVDCSRTSAYCCLQGQTLKTISLWLKAHLGTEEGEASMKKSQRKGKVSDGHNVQLAVLMAGKRNRGGDGPGQSLRLNSYSHTNPNSFTPNSTLEILPSAKACEWITR